MFTGTTILPLLLCTVVTAIITVPFIRDVTFVPLSNTSSFTINNRTCQECLCASNSSHMILNCVPNKTCQFFVNASRKFTLQPTPNAILYFPQQVLPDSSQCCMGNTTDLVQQLNTAALTYASVTSPLCLVIDNHGYVVTVSQTDRTIVRFNAKNLTRITQPPSPLFSADPIVLSHYNGAYYVGFNYYILVVDTENMTVLHNIGASELQGTRDMIFLNSGQQMIVASTFNNRLLFFNRSSSTSYNYVFVRYRDVSCHNPHGLFYINDDLFYLTSWGNNTLYTFSNPGNTTVWSETLVFDAPRVDDSAGASHVSIDDCGRHWLSLRSSGTQIFDSQGSPGGALYSTGAYIFDTLMLDNYVLYLSDNTGNRIIRFDPNIQC